MKYRLTLTTEPAQESESWRVGVEHSEKDGLQFDLDEADDAMYLIDEIKGAIAKWESAEHEKKLKEIRGMFDSKKEK